MSFFSLHGALAFWKYFSGSKQMSFPQKTVKRWFCSLALSCLSPGYSRLWGLLSRHSRFFSALKLLKNRQATQAIAIVAPGLRSEDKEKFLSVWIYTYIFFDYLLTVSTDVRQQPPLCVLHLRVINTFRYTSWMQIWNWDNWKGLWALLSIPANELFTKNSKTPPQVPKKRKVLGKIVIFFQEKNGWKLRTSNVVIT